MNTSTNSLYAYLQSNRFVGKYIKKPVSFVHLSLTNQTLTALSVILFASIGFLTYAANTLPDNNSLRYPLQEVSAVECRSKARADHSDACKKPLPRIQGADFNKYADDALRKNIYSMRWEGSYSKAKRNTEGSHPGVDISTAKGTPIYAIADGEVYAAKTQAGYGNVIKIKFIYKGQLYYATYAHLDKILVKAGDTITKGEVIGKVGNSGTAGGALGGYHLHFEIDVPEGERLVYAFWECDDRQVGANEEGVVNQGLCRDKLEARTKDPIRFLEQANATIESGAPVVVEVAEAPLPPTMALTQDGEIVEIQTAFLSDEIKEFVRHYSFNLVSKQGKITVTALHKTTQQPYQGTLPASLEISSPDPSITFSPSTVGLLPASVDIVIAGGNGKAVVNFAGQQISVIDIIAPKLHASADTEGVPIVLAGLDEGIDPVLPKVETTPPNTVEVKAQAPVGRYACRYTTEERAKYFF